MVIDIQPVNKSNRVVRLLVILMLILASNLAYWSYSIYFYRSQQSALLYFPKGTKIIDIAEQLEKYSAINNAKVFIAVAYWGGLFKKYLKSGEYNFEAGLNMWEVWRKMVSGELYIRKITIPEGLTNFQVSLILAKAVGLMGGIELTQIEEGNLMPDTYHYHFGDSKESIIKRMLESSKTFLEANRNKNKYPTLLDSDQKILTLASIIEEEAKQQHEMPIIASVYINRLKSGMLLQADPTVIYAVSNKTGELDHSLTKGELQFDSAYNTYKYTGLPPTPIAAPSRHAILAALTPADTNYLYFVADRNGGHKFSSTLAEHNKNVKSYWSSQN